MKKIIVLIVYTISICGFAQQLPQPTLEEDVSRIDFDALFRWNKVTFRLDKPIIKGLFVLRTNVSFNYSGFELTESVFIPLNEYLSFSPTIGFKFDYSEDLMKPIFRGEFRGRHKKFSGRFSFGHNLNDFNYYLRGMYDVYGRRLSIGFESRDLKFGPRVEYEFLLNMKLRKRVRLSASYTDKQLFYSIRINIEEWIPRWYIWIKKIGNNIIGF